jgi:hypothetical protein
VEAGVSGALLFIVVAILAATMIFGTVKWLQRHRDSSQYDL